MTTDKEGFEFLAKEMRTGFAQVTAAINATNERLDATNQRIDSLTQSVNGKLDAIGSYLLQIDKHFGPRTE